MSDQKSSNSKGIVKRQSTSSEPNVKIEDRTIKINKFSNPKPILENNHKIRNKQKVKTRNLDNFQTPRSIQPASLEAALLNKLEN